jgi:hypothetical protein
MWWTRRYTVGLPGPLTGSRRAEITSDLAEHAHLRRGEGWPAGRIARERLGRLGRGVPADLVWRGEVLADASRSTGAVRSLVIAVTSVASVMLAVFCAAFALYVSGSVALADRALLHGLANYADVVDHGVDSTIAAVVLAGLSVSLLVSAVARPISPLVANVATFPVAILAVLWFWLGISPLGLVVVAGAATDMGLRAPDLARPS